MAVDKKSDYVGNHGGAYTDINGMRKQFTMIDHDIKPKMTMPITQDEFDEAREFAIIYRKNLIDKILELPAVSCPPTLVDFTLRGDRRTVDWDETMLRDEGLPIERLRELYSLSSNRLDLSKFNLL